MFFIALAAVGALSTGADIAEPASQRAGDLQIREALLQEYKTNPERVVCIQRTYTGSRQPRAVCGSLARFWAARPAREVAAGDPPWALVEQIKENRRKAEAKARSGGG